MAAYAKAMAGIYRYAAFIGDVFEGSLKL